MDSVSSSMKELTFLVSLAPAGDLSKELDVRVKEQVALLRGKDECKYELVFVTKYMINVC